MGGSRPGNLVHQVGVALAVVPLGAPGLDLGGECGWGCGIGAGWIAMECRVGIGKVLVLRRRARRERRVRNRVEWRI